MQLSSLFCNITCIGIRRPFVVFFVSILLDLFLLEFVSLWFQNIPSKERSSWLTFVSMSSSFIIKKLIASFLVLMFVPNRCRQSSPVALKVMFFLLLSVVVDYWFLRLISSCFCLSLKVNCMIVYISKSGFQWFHFSYCDE